VYEKKERNIANKKKKPSIWLNHHSTFVINHLFIIPALAVKLRIEAVGLNHPYTPV
jgi:hypothetical protein